MTSRCWTLCLITCAALTGWGTGPARARAAPPDDIQTLTARLRDPSQSRDAQRELVAQGTAALPTLEALYAADATPGARHAVVEVACALGEPGTAFIVARSPGVVEPLVQAALRRRDETVDACIVALRQIGLPAVTRLAREVENPSSEGRVQAMRWLAKLGDRRGAAPIAATLRHATDAQVRFHAVQALEALPTPEAIDAVVFAITRDPDLQVNAAAAGTLGRMQDPRAHAAAITLLKSSSVKGTLRRQIARELQQHSADPEVVAAAKRLEPWFFPDEYPPIVGLVLGFAVLGGLLVGWGFLVHLAGVLVARYEAVRPILALAWLVTGLIPFSFGFLFSSRPVLGGSVSNFLLVFILGPVVLGIGMLMRGVMRRWSPGASALWPNPVVVELIALYGGYLLGIFYRLA